MWSPENLCVCCMCKSEDYKQINEIDVSYGPLCVHEILYKTVPPVEQINKLNPNKFSLPEIICLPCYDNLLKSYKFQEQCLASIQRLYQLWDEHQLETPIASLDKLQTKEEIKMEIEVESPCVQNEYEVEKYYIKELKNEQQKLPPEKEVNADVLGEDVDDTDGFNASDEEFLVVEKKSPENESPKNNSPENKISRPNIENRRSGYYPCDDCGKIFDRPCSLLRHSSVHSLERPHECNKCKYRFATPKRLKAHMVLHEKGTNLTEKKSRRKPKELQPDKTEATCSCMVCGTVCVSAKTLRIHTVRKHPEVELLKCDKCDKTFVLRAHLLEHLNRHTNNLICLTCQKEFVHPTGMNAHKCKLISSQPSYPCTECGKSFRRLGNLREHQTIHTNLRNFKCPDCPSRFNTRSALINHALTHNNVKPHTCDVCSASFPRPCALRNHKRIHTGERPYKCDQCDRAFTMRTALTVHKRIHTGEKPLQCKFCGRAYNQHGALNKHLRTHVGENTHMCEECPKAFKYLVELKQHKAEHFKPSQKLLEHSQGQSNEKQDETSNELKQ